MNASQRWNFGPGVFVAQALSQQIVSSGDASPLATLTSMSPKPSAAAVKFGGDWGGLWGSPATWGALSPKSKTPPPLPIIPYLYPLPQHIDAYPAMIGGLFADGYPAVILDVEMDWEGHEKELGQLLDQLNLADNLIGLCGYAWYDGWQDQGRAMAEALKGKDLIYMPMAYAGVGWISPSGPPMDYIEAELFGLGIIEHSSTAFIFDGLALDQGWRDAISSFHQASWYWYSQTLTVPRWRYIQPGVANVGNASAKVVLEKVRQKLAVIANDVDDLCIFAGKS